jgi:hypothetical protein
MPITGLDLTTILNYMKEQAPLKPFNQGEFRQSTGGEVWSSFNGKDLSNGYCAGVALDWIRRVLLGGRDSYDKNANKARTEQQQQSRTMDSVERMGRAWAGTSGGKGARELTFVSSSTSSQSKLVAELQQMLTRGGPTSTVEPEDSTRAAFQKFYATYDSGSGKSSDQYWSKPLINEMIADVSGGTGLSTERNWAEYAPFLDTIYSQQRTQRGKAGKRAFTGIEVESTSPAQTYAAGTWAPKLREMLKNDRGVLLGASDAIGGTGHAVAIHTPSGSYQLFDPNFGVYTCGTVEKLTTFVNILFGNFTYTLRNSDNSINKIIRAPIYGNSTTKKVDWAIFKKAA